MPSAAADVGRQYGSTSAQLSEFRAAVRAAAGDLYGKVDAALPRAKDTATILHLRLIRAQLNNVP